MALTEIPVELSSTPSIVDGGNATSITINSSEEVTFAAKVTAVGTSVFTNLDISGDVDIDGATNLDVVDIDGAVDMASTLAVAGVATLTGNVGIGAARTDGTLHVHTGTAGTVAASTQADDIVIENSAEGGMTIITPDDQSARIRFTSPSTNNEVGGAFLFYRQNINKMQIGTAVSGGVLSLASGAGSEAISIDASQRVGIGASSISSWTKLQIAGTAGAQTGATQALYVTSPSTTANEGVGIRMSAASGSHEAVGIIGMVNNASGNAGSMTFHTYNGGANIPERMRIDSSGNVAIGQNTSSASLLVQGADQTDGTMRLQAHSNKGARASHIHHGTNGDWYIRSADTDGKVIINDGGGNVGIGDTTATTTIDLTGAMLMRSNITNIGLGTYTVGNGMNTATGGELEFIHMWTGTMATGDTIAFTYNAINWKSWWFEIIISSTGSNGEIFRAGGYNNNSDGHAVTQGSGASLAVSRNGQANTFTLTLTTSHVHPLIKIRYGCGGGEGPPQISRAALVITS